MELTGDAPEHLVASHRAWLRAVNENDLASYLDVVSENVVWIPPGRDAVEGRADLRRWLIPFFEQYHYEFSVRDIALQIANAWAVERGIFRSRMTPRTGGHTMEHSGRFLIFWRREDDSQWRIDRYLDETPVEGVRS